MAFAPISGAGFNPVRGLAPDPLANAYPAVSIYLIGSVGGGVPAGFILLRRNHRAPTGKLRHDPHITCHMRCALPHTT